MAWAEKTASGKYRGGYRLKSGERRFTEERYTRKADAQREAAALEADARRPGWRDPRKGDMTWGEWLEKWESLRVIEGSTTRNEKSMIQTWLLPKWRDVPLNEITHQDVQRWANEMGATNLARHKDSGLPDEDAPRYLASSTVRRYLNPFVSSMSAATEAGLIPANPATSIKLPPMPLPREVYFTREQYTALRAAVPLRSDRALLDFLVGTGARWGEAAGAHTDRLDLRRGDMTIAEVWDGEQIKPYPKGRSLRHVPLMQWVVEDLDVPSGERCGLRHKSGMCRGALLFPSKRGRVRDLRSFTRWVWEPAIKKAGLVELGATIHDLRHTYASWLIQSGVPLERVSELLGHKDLKTTQRYAHLAPVKSSDVEHALIDPARAVPAPAETSNVIAFPTRRR
jgi:integrase